MADFLLALDFWILYEALSWPLRLALTPIPMRGDLRRMISRVAGPAIIIMASWLAAHAIIPLGVVTCWLWFLLFMAGGYFICRIQGVKPNWKQVLLPISDRKRWRQELFLELFSLAIFFVFLGFRRMTPEMTAFDYDGSAAEKFDNAMFFWAAWHAKWLPPDDYWLSGHTQAYYYWGHFFWAWIGRMGFFRGEWVITLALSRAVSLTWEASYLLVRSFGARPLSAAIGAFFISWGGAPKAVQTLFHQYEYHSGRSATPVGQKKPFPFKPELIKKALNGNWNFGGYAFWEPSRVIPNTVNEYPSWSMILGDFHAHHLSIPWMIAWLALLVSGDRWFSLHGPRKGTAGPSASAESPRPPPSDEVRVRIAWIRYGLWLAIFFTLGVATAVSNFWVAPLLLVASLGILLWKFPARRFGLGVKLLMLVIFAFYVFGAAYLSRGTLESPLPPGPAKTGTVSLVDKIAAKSPLKLLDPTIRSKAIDLFLLWGFQCLPIGAMILVGFLARRRTLASYIWMAAAAVFVLLKLAVLRTEPALFWMGAACGTMSLTCTRRPWLSLRAALLTASGFLILAGLERFYIKDRFVGDLVRYNSYFKMGYPVWPVLGAAAWIGAQRLWRLWRNSGLSLERRLTEAPLYWGFRAALLLLVPFVMTLVIFGMPARVVQARVRPEQGTRGEPTLDAFQWLTHRKEYAADAQLLAWIRRNIEPRERIAEAAVMVSYKFNGRVASHGGHPVPLGWGGHEHQWRGDEAAVKPVGEALKKTAALYEAKSPDEMRQAAKDLGVKWVVFGKCERDYYTKSRDAARADQILAMLRETAKARAMFPVEKPESYIFNMDEAPDPLPLRPAGTTPPRTTQ